MSDEIERMRSVAARILREPSECTYTGGQLQTLCHSYLEKTAAAQPWPDPTPEMLATPLFDAIWTVIKTWDVNVPHAYVGYCGATGNHARAIYDAVVGLCSRPTGGEEHTVAVGPVPNRSDGLLSLHVGPSHVLISQDEADRLADLLRSMRWPR